MASLPAARSLHQDSMVDDHEYFQGFMCLHCTDRFRGAKLYVQWYRVSHPGVEGPRWSVDNPTDPIMRFHPLC